MWVGMRVKTILGNHILEKARVETILGNPFDASVKETSVKNYAGRRE